MAQSIPLLAPPATRLRGIALRIADDRFAALSFVATVGLAFGLNAWSLTDNGYGNTYYAAAARSMAHSWSNFFFAAFDPGGFISVDKPPVFLWVDAFSVRVFGYHSLSLLLPSAIAGAASVALVWLIVKRYAGTLPALVAGLVLALTPISVGVNRLNLPEPFYILALVGAAGAVLRSLEGRRWWAWTVLAGALVGVAFNTKMLAGWVPGPAFALALVVGDGDTFRSALRRIALRLGLLAAVTFLVSASWMVVVDAWPASSRPYVGGSTDDQVSNLVLDYNGLGRVEGATGQPGTNGGPGGNGAARGPFGGNQPPASGAPSTGTTGANTNPQRQPGGQGAGAGGFPGGAPGSPGGAPGLGGIAGAGGIIAGTPGLWRMFDGANGQQIAWFLPFALLGGALCLWRWRRDRVRRAAVLLFAGWVLLFGGVFSYAEGTYHAYYTAAMAPGIAVLAGLTVAAAMELVREDRRWLAAISGVVAVTLAVQLMLTGRFPDHQAALVPLALGAVAGAGILALSALLWRSVPARPALLVAVAGLLIMPASWAVYEANHPSANTTLPQAGPREGSASRSFGSEAFDSGSSALASWIAAHHADGATWDLAVSSAQNASSLMAEHDLSVMAIGGFMGTDPSITVAGFADLVAEGQVRYVLASGISGRGFAPGSFGGSRQGATTANGSASPAAGAANSPAGANAIMTAARSVCSAVSSSEVPSQYRGSIYDCAGKADALRAAG